MKRRLSSCLPDITGPKASSGGMPWSAIPFGRILTIRQMIGSLSGSIPMFPKPSFPASPNDNEFANPLSAIAQIPFSRPYLEDGITPNTETTLYYNFLMDQFNGNFDSNVWRAFFKIYGQVNFSNNLFFRSEYGYDYNNQLEERFFGSLTQSASTNGAADAFNIINEKYVLNNYFTYLINRDTWQLETTLGMSYEENKLRQLFVEGQDFPSDQLQKLISAGQITDGFTFETDYSFVSYFARASATLFNSWLLKASVRVDGSSRFGEDVKYGTFPAASVGWLASEESFLKGNSTLSNLKLRASWGLTGNANIGNFLSSTQFYHHQLQPKPRVLA